MPRESGFWVAPNWPYIRKITMTSQFFDMTSSPNFFDSFYFSYQVWLLGQNSCQYHHWFWSYDNFLKGLTRNPEVRNTPVWVFLYIWRPGQVRDTKFGTRASNKILLNAAKCQGYSFYRFWVTKGKPMGGESKITPSPSQIRVNEFSQSEIKQLLIRK